jgi:hypothetical protein
MHFTDAAAAPADSLTRSRASVGDSITFASIPAAYVSNCGLPQSRPMPSIAARCRRISN